MSMARESLCSLVSLRTGMLVHRPFDEVIPRLLESIGGDGPHAIHGMGHAKRGCGFKVAHVNGPGPLCFGAHEFASSACETADHIGLRFTRERERSSNGWAVGKIKLKE